MRAQTGITLIEMLTVMTIVIILTVIATPLLINYTQVYRLRGTIQTLYSSLQYARSEAIKRNTPVYIGFQTGSNWCYGLNINSVCDCTNTCPLGTTSAARTQQMTMSFNGNSGPLLGSIAFDGTRGTTNATNLITLTIYGQNISMSINVTPLGNMSICSSTVSGYPACP
jgi:type IV fimbrial biogenesis protein FimT